MASFSSRQGCAAEENGISCCTGKAVFGKGEMRMTKNGNIRKPKRRIALWILLVAVLILTAATAVYAADYYRAEPSANAVLTESISGVTVVSSKERIDFVPETARAGLVFYPGGKVEFTAYAPLMASLAKEGILCVLLKMPLNLAVLNGNAAEKIPEEYPGIGTWILAGHSLGGVMAASCAAKHPGEWDALALLASYSTADVGASGMRVLSMYGSSDGVLNRKEYEDNRKNLPPDAKEVVIEGGCHAYFGFYGAQKGDGNPTVSREEQQAAAVREILLLAGN